jgi:WhiB family transcriptional regulator, redox-sensing transcriptional regulator
MRDDEPVTLEDFLRRPAWHAEALCRGRGTEPFSRGPKSDHSAVKVVCAACPVRQECLSFALADETLLSLWGGVTERERRVMRRGRAVA